MKAIGGYFELELPCGNEYHATAISLNTGRNAFEYLLRVNNYKKIYLPYYSCDALLQPIERLGIDYEFYSIDEHLEALFDVNTIRKDEALLYVNYFGLKSAYTQSLKDNCDALIIDNVQAFYESPLADTDTIYSPRKFFGVPDGAYLYCNQKANFEIGDTFSFQRCESLLRRIDVSAEDGYPYFLASENTFEDLPIGSMSQLTKRILQSIDYNHISAIRSKNYQYLHAALASINRLEIDLNHKNVPMVYPLFTNDQTLRKKLIDQKIYTAQYWPNVLDWCKNDSFEYKLAKELVSLPIDQRLNFKDLDKIINIVLS